MGPSDGIPDDAALAEMKKHDPVLQSKWNIYEHYILTKDKGGYQDATKKVSMFGTVKEFWGSWNHLPQPSVLLEGKRFARKEADGSRTIVDGIYIFRKGIEPLWEHPENVKGGHFMLQLKPSLGAGLIDEIWNNVVIGMIGGAIQPAEVVNGVRLVDKLGVKGKPSTIRIELWFNDMDANDTGMLYNLRGAFERCLATSLDGSSKVCTWGYTETVPHQQDEAGESRFTKGSRGGRR